MDPTVVEQLRTLHGRGAAGLATFDNQHMAIIIAAAQNDSRMMNGFLASQLFNEQAMQAKTAYHTPLDPSAAPLPSTPASK